MSPSGFAALANDTIAQLSEVPRLPGPLLTVIRRVVPHVGDAAYYSEYTSVAPYEDALTFRAGSSYVAVSGEKFPGYATEAQLAALASLIASSIKAHGHGSGVLIGVAAASLAGCILAIAFQPLDKRPLFLAAAVMLVVSVVAVFLVQRPSPNSTYDSCRLLSAGDVNRVFGGEGAFEAPTPLGECRYFLTPSQEYTDVAFSTADDWSQLGVSPIAHRTSVPGADECFRWVASFQAGTTCRKGDHYVVVTGDTRVLPIVLGHL